MSDFYVEIPGNESSAYDSSGNAYTGSDSAYESFGAVEGSQASEPKKNNQQGPQNQPESSSGSQPQQQQSLQQSPQQSSQQQSQKQSRTSSSPIGQSSRVLKPRKTSQPRIRVAPKRQVMAQRVAHYFDWGSYLLGVLSGIIIYWGYRKLKRPKR